MVFLGVRDGLQDVETLCRLPAMWTHRENMGTHIRHTWESKGASLAEASQKVAQTPGEGHRAPRMHPPHALWDAVGLVLCSPTGVSLRF